MQRWELVKDLNFSFQAASLTSIFDFTATDIDGNEVNLSAYKDHVCIIVNVASKWGKTAVNYQQLVALHKKVIIWLISNIFFVGTTYIKPNA